jgi:hypothetical protein
MDRLDGKSGWNTSYSPELCGIICDELIAGRSLREICREPKMPHLSTVRRWVLKYPDFYELYTKARQSQADTLAEDILEIADSGAGEGDTMVAVNRARLQVDARKWLAARMGPKRWGGKLDESEDGPTPGINITTGS